MTMFMPQLRDAIMPIHDQAEKHGPLSEIPKKTLTLDKYSKLLGRLYGFVYASELCMEPLLDNYASDLEWPKRKRVGHLLKDLIFLGESRMVVDALPKCQDVSSIQTTAQALGTLYLFEGSRLGGLVLSKALREHFGFQNFDGYAYFGSNGVEVVPMWQTFKNFMEKYVASNGGEQEIILSAKDSFESLNKWIAAH